VFREAQFVTSSLDGVLRLVETAAHYGSLKVMEEMIGNSPQEETFHDERFFLHWVWRRGLRPARYSIHKIYRFRQCSYYQTSVVLRLPKLMDISLST
jgi:hypothetical protein